MTSVQVEDSVVIVGAGIIGVACAHYLNASGVSVTVIDQGLIGSGCSYGNCGHICPSHLLPLNEPGAIKKGIRSFFDSQSPFKLKLSLDPSFLRWLAEFSFRCRTDKMLDLASKLQPLLESSMEEYLAVVDSLDCGWQQKGLLYVYSSEQALEGFASTDRLLDDYFGVKATQLSGAELHRLDSRYKASLAGAFHYQGDAHTQPDKLLSSWVSQLRDSGVRFIENCKLESWSMEMEQNKVTELITSNGKIKAEQFVIAAGVWSSQLAKVLDYRAPMQPGKGYSLTVNRKPEHPEYPAFFLEKGVGIATFEDSFRVGSLMEIVGFDSSIPSERVDYLRRAIQPYLNELDICSDSGESWSGWRPMTWDSLPIIGRTPKHRNVILATGHHMLGLTMAPGTGKLVSEIVLDKPTHIDESAYSPARF